MTSLSLFFDQERKVTMQNQERKVTMQKEAAGHQALRRVLQMGLKGFNAERPTANTIRYADLTAPIAERYGKSTTQELADTFSGLKNKYTLELQKQLTPTQRVVGFGRNILQKLSTPFRKPLTAAQRYSNHIPTSGRLAYSDLSKNIRKVTDATHPELSLDNTDTYKTAILNFVKNRGKRYAAVDKRYKAINRSKLRNKVWALLNAGYGDEAAAIANTLGDHGLAADLSAIPLIHTYKFNRPVIATPHISSKYTSLRADKFITDNPNTRGKVDLSRPEIDGHNANGGDVGHGVVLDGTDYADNVYYSLLGNYADPSYYEVAAHIKRLPQYLNSKVPVTKNTRNLFKKIGIDLDELDKVSPNELQSRDSSIVYKGTPYSRLSATADSNSAAAFKQRTGFDTTSGLDWTSYPGSPGYKSAHLLHDMVMPDNPQARKWLDNNEAAAWFTPNAKGSRTYMRDSTNSQFTKPEMLDTTEFAVLNKDHVRKMLEYANKTPDTIDINNMPPVADAALHSIIKRKLNPGHRSELLDTLRNELQHTNSIIRRVGTSSPKELQLERDIDNIMWRYRSL